MPRPIDSDDTFETLRDETWFTGARLADEPLAAALFERTDEWQARIDACDKTARALDKEETQVEAQFAGGNLVLDAACTDFGDDLLVAVAKDRASPRWRAFFRSSVSDFILQPLSQQVVAVRGWLTESSDEVLLQHKPKLEVAATRVERAVAREAALAVRRATHAQDREALTASLTAQRDALHGDLSALARTNRLPRAWADSFFRATKGARRKPVATT